MMDWLKKVAAQLGTDLEKLEQESSAPMGLGEDTLFGMGPEYRQAMVAAGMLDEEDIPQDVNIFDGGFDLPAPAPQQEEVPQGFSFRLNQLEQLREVEQMMAQYEAEIDREN